MKILFSLLALALIYLDLTSSFSLNTAPRLWKMCWKMKRFNWIGTSGCPWSTISSREWLICTTMTWFMESCGRVIAWLTVDLCWKSLILDWERWWCLQSLLRIIITTTVEFIFWCFAVELILIFIRIFVGCTGNLIGYGFAWNAINSKRWCLLVCCDFGGDCGSRWAIRVCQAVYAGEVNSWTGRSSWKSSVSAFCWRSRLSTWSLGAYGKMLEWCCWWTTKFLQRSDDCWRNHEVDLATSCIF